jgi:hypothetical protein
MMMTIIFLNYNKRLLFRFIWTRQALSSHSTPYQALRKTRSCLFSALSLILLIKLLKFSVVYFAARAKLVANVPRVQCICNAMQPRLWPDQSLPSLSTNSFAVDNYQSKQLRCWQLSIINFLAVDNYQLKLIRCWQLSIINCPTVAHPPICGMIIVYVRGKEKTQWEILTKETTENIHLTQIHNCVLEIKIWRKFTIVFSKSNQIAFLINNFSRCLQR